MDKNLLVSVVMPTYNHASYIKPAIDSILSQTYSNIELIIVDNHSTDGTEDIVAAIEDTRIRYFKFANNGVIAASRNYGAQQAKGALIAFIDSDDLWYEDKIQIQVDDFAEEPELGLSSGCLQIMNGDVLDPVNYRGNKGQTVCGHLYPELINFNFVCSSSVMVRKDVFDQVGGFNEREDLKYIEDYFMWLAVAHEFKIKSHNMPVGIVRLHDTNCSHDEFVVKRDLLVVDEHLKMKWIDEKQAGTIKSGIFFRHGWGCIESDPKEARSLFKSVFKLKYKSPKMTVLSLAGMMFTFMPFVYRFMTKNRIDKKIGRLLLGIKGNKSTT